MSGRGIQRNLCPAVACLAGATAAGNDGGAVPVPQGMGGQSFPLQMFAPNRLFSPPDDPGGCCLNRDACICPDIFVFFKLALSRLLYTIPHQDCRCAPWPLVAMSGEGRRKRQYRSLHDSGFREVARCFTRSTFAESLSGL
jgi:hypothetical protein